MSEKKQVMSQGSVLLMAWGVEIIAASVGLFLAISRMIGTPSSEGLSIFIAIQGALPFFAVAIIELTKIPLAYVFYTAKALRWRLVLLASLSLAMVITFETFFIGFEMYQSLLVRDLRPTLNAIAEQKRIIRITSEDKRSSEDILSRKNEAIRDSKQIEDSINSKFDKREEELKRQKEEVYKKYETQTGPLQARLKSIKDDLSALEKRYQAESKRIEEARSKATDAALAGADAAKSRGQENLNSLRSQRESIVSEATKRRNQIIEGKKIELTECILRCATIQEEQNKALAQIDNDERRQLATIDGQVRRLESRLSESSVDTSSVRDQFAIEFNHLKTVFEADKRALEKERSEALEKIAKATGSISKSDQIKINDIEAKLTNIADERQEELASEKRRFDTQQKEFDTQSANASSAVKLIAEAKKALVPHCTELNAKVVDNQVYRLAMQLFGSEDACALTEEELSLTKAIWFGSLAIIVSALGTILALAAFVLRDPPQPIIVSSRPLGDRLRLALVAIRRRMNTPKIKEVEVPVDRIVEVTKEVPVDRVVFRDIPVEVIKKEVTHIPVYTNDPSLLGEKFRPTEEQ